MKKKRYTTEQMISVLKECEATGSISEVCRKHGIAPTTFYSWKAKYGGMQVPDAKRLKELEVENAKLKRLLGPSWPKVVSPQARREAVGILMAERQMGVTRPCGLVGISRSLLAYQPRRREPEGLRERIGEIALAKRRYGYRRVHVLLRREGWEINHKR